MTTPRSTHFTIILYILCYVKGTLFHSLHFSSSSNLELTGYCDVDWIDDRTDHRSITGYCFFLDDFLMFWYSKKQTIIARSSTETEYQTFADATSELL